MKSKKIISVVFSIMFLSSLSIAHASEKREYIKINVDSKINGGCYPETLVSKDKSTGEFLTCRNGRWMHFDNKQ